MLCREFSIEFKTYLDTSAAGTKPCAASILQDMKRACRNPGVNVMNIQQFHYS